MLKLISIFSERALLHSKLFQYENFISLLFKKFNKTAHSTEPFNKILPIIIKLTDAELKVRMEQNLINYDLPRLNNFTKHLFKNNI